MTHGSVVFLGQSWWWRWRSCVSAASAGADQGLRLDWQGCGDAAGVQCATAKVPLDYANPGGGTTKLFVARSPATDRRHRIGSLFLNFGGPGGTMADIVEAYGADLFPELNERYDIVGMDPRGVGQSEPVDRLQGQPGDRRDLLEPVHDAGQPERRRADPQGPGVRQPLRRAQPQDPARTSRRPTSRATSTS